MSKAKPQSYDFGKFVDNSSELSRLKRQASIALKLEMDIWMSLGVAKGAEVLDAACGPGITTCELARVVSPGKVTGLDLNPTLLSEALIHKAQGKVTNVDFVAGDVYQLPFENRFDFAYARFLFQHLSDPKTAATNLLKSLKAGGRVCVVDVDDAWLGVHPGSDTFTEFTRRAAMCQSANGGDRYVGRKLGAYLQAAGFVNVKIDVHMVSSAKIGMKNFLDITTGFKKEQFSSKERDWATSTLGEIYKLEALPGAWGAVGVFVVTAERPAKGT